MTNVPDNIREMWADVYKLFDVNYKMPNNTDAWTKFWDQAVTISEKHGNPPYLMSLLNVVSQMIEYKQQIDRLDAEGKPSALEDMNLF